MVVELERALSTVSDGSDDASDDECGSAHEHDCVALSVCEGFVPYAKGSASEQDGESNERGGGANASCGACGEVKGGALWDKLSVDGICFTRGHVDGECIGGEVLLFEDERVFSWFKLDSQGCFAEVFAVSFVGLHVDLSLTGEGVDRDC